MHSSIKSLAVLTLGSFLGAAIAAPQDDTSSSFPIVGKSNSELRNAIVQLQDRVDKLQRVALAQHKLEIAKSRQGISGAWADRLILSGSVQAQALASNRSDEGSFTQGSASKMKINNINLTAHARLLDDLNGIVSLDSQPGGVDLNGNENGDNVFFEQAYLHMGNAQKGHYLFNFGRKFVPFGVYKQHPVLSTLTQSLSEQVKTTAEVGANFHPFYASAYIYNSQGNVQGSNNGARSLGNGGLEIGVFKTDPTFGYDFSVGYNNNMAEAKAIYARVRSSYHHVPALALHGALTYGDWAFVADYTTPTNHFDSRAISFETQGAKPTAFASEISYSFLTANHPSTLAAGYQSTREALFLNLPKTRYTASYTYYVNHYLDVVVEYVRDHDYGTSDSATYTQTRTSASSTPVTGTGRLNNTALVQLGLHF